MTIEQELVEIEHSLWTNDASVYDAALVDEALLVFGETGVIGKGVAIDAIKAENADGRRWAEAAFEDVRVLRLADDAQLLTYTVAARWKDDSETMHALASSVYVRRGGAWKLAFHQQTPLDA
jgi:hypothetical protein